MMNCDRLGLQLLYEDHDWAETFVLLNISHDTAINARFQWNALTKITKFSPMCIVELDFRHNRISEIEDFAFAFLPNLTSLDLSDNELTAESLREKAFFGSNSEHAGYMPMPVLHLNLSNNQIHTYVCIYILIVMIV